MMARPDALSLIFRERYNIGETRSWSLDALEKIWRIPWWVLMSYQARRCPTLSPQARTGRPQLAGTGADALTRDLHRTARSRRTLQPAATIHLRCVAASAR